MAEVILLLHCYNSEFTIAVIVIQVTIKRSIFIVGDILLATCFNSDKTLGLFLWG